MLKINLYQKVKHQICRYASFILIFILLIPFFSACTDKQGNSSKADDIVSLEEIKNIPEESLYIEWLGSRGFNADERTMILIHGESPDNFDKKFSMTLNYDDYIYYAEDKVNYNVDKDVDYINRILYEYWLEQNYNVGIFHYEKFADDSLDRVSKKIFNKASMRFKTEEGYNASKIPNFSLTEILAAVFLKEIPKEAYGNEIRLIGNGLGANLALSLCDYLYSFNEHNKIRSEILPHRLSLIDPYLSDVKFDNAIRWRSFNKHQSMLSIADKMLDYTTERGLVVDLVENVEVDRELKDDISVEKLVSPYEYKLYDETGSLQKSIKNKVAYLLLRQKYSLSYSANYRLQNRAGLDWYLYSIRGSDDSRTGSPSDTSADYESTYCNWGRYNTRPFINDMARNNNSSGGKNYAVSAWTETVWVRALRGVEFKMLRSTGQLKDENNKTVKDIHDQYVYNYTDTELPRFRSENSQRAINMNRTIVAGYVWDDKNEDRQMNEGVGSYLSNLDVNIRLAESSSSEEAIDFQVVTTSRDGFYIATFNNSFKKTLTVTITVVPPSSAFNVQTAPASTYHVAGLTRHTFNKNTKSLTISSNYGNAITMANCGLVIK